VKSSIVYTTLIASGLLFFPFSPTVSAEETTADETSAEKIAKLKQAEKLEDITVQATRVDKSLYEIPASVGFVDKDDIQFGRQQLGLDEGMNKIPGLWMQNRYNFNQDLSISIRGFGKRSAFGLRGIRVYVDGIPNTLPDGQGSIDSIDIGSVDRAEVIRGPSSSLYGTASGGVINLYTEDGPAVPYVEARVLAGSYDFSQFQLKTGGQKNSLNYLFNLSRMNNEGYRDHSKIERTMLNSKLRYEFDYSSDLTLTFNVLDKPIADDPGGLTAAQVKANRRQAQPVNLSNDVGETVDQQQIGLLYRKAFNDNHETIFRNYHVIREFDNKVPFNSVTLDRYFVGGGIQHNYTDQFFGHNNRLVAGFDIDSQMDTRKNFANAGGSIGALRLHQDEDVFSWGVFLQNEFAITQNLELNFGVRYDEVKFDFTDYFITGLNPDDSGTIEFKEWSPQVGLLWKAHDAINVYGTVSTSFETPTSTEFAAPSGAGGGFNQALTAQTATNYEIGIKGVLPGRTSYQLSLFTMDVTDEILPAGTNPDTFATFFSNAGETKRTGIEAALTFRPLPGLDVSLAYTYSDFEFETFTVGGTSFAGNHIPGIPEQFGYIEVAYFSPSGFHAAFDTQFADKVFVNNANSLAADKYMLSNFRMGYTTNIGDTEFTPFFGVNNIFNQEYIGNVRVNEGNSRFFEPAPELNVFAGISLTFR